MVNLKTELPLSKNRGKIALGEVLLDLNSKFPEGFYAHEASKFLKKLFGDDVPENLRTELRIRYINQWSSVYSNLAQLGYLESVRERSKRYLYSVIPDVAKGVQPPMPIVWYEFSLPQDMGKLVDYYQEVLVINIGKQLVEELEKIILNNREALQKMAALKRKSPQDYANIAGLYLDGLLKGNKKI